MPVKKVITNTKVPVKIWTDQVESEALKQLTNLASLPFIFKHVAAMPDVHLGKGATVGSVIATKNAIIPAAVGVDIGCGMMAVKTDLSETIVRENIKKIRSRIEEKIPLGHLGNETTLNSVLEWKGWQHFDNLRANGIDSTLKNRAISQLGSLGGGNHFIEICLDTENNVWLMLHSGSRNIGKELAERHILEAKGLMKKFMISLPDPDLAYLVAETKEYDDYLFDLKWAQDYAFQNRIEMMRRVEEAIMEVCSLPSRITRLMEVNCHHNYVVMEHHFGENVLVTRKGAVRARKGDLGIIPGSMGTRSYIVAGLGNKDSFCSCSHGAGRRLSRAEAKRRFGVNDLKEQTEGVECRKDQSVIDEIPGAYKDIDQVMENQKDLVEVVAELKQIMCVKG